MHRRRKKKRPIRSALVYILIISGLSAAAFSYKAINSYMQHSITSFKLNDIEVTGNRILSKEDVLNMCGLEEGEELIDIKPVEVVNRLTPSPYIKTASAVRSLPSRLRIVIEERKPRAFVHGKGLNIIDNEGVLLPVPSTNRRWDLPFISGKHRSLGELGNRTPSGKVLKAIEILNYLAFLESPLEDLVAEIKMGSRNQVQLRLTQGGARVFLNEKQYQENLFVLSEYINNYLDWESLDKIDYLDVRFKDQLIKKEHAG